MHTVRMTSPMPGVLLLQLAVLMLLATSTNFAADAAAIVDDYSQSDEQRRQNDRLLAIQVLEDLIAKIRSEQPDMNKRQFDGGYGSRYVAAHSVGSKLMALKQAADWNSPGRK